MALADTLERSGAIDAMARELGVSPAAARTAAGALLPAIVAGLGRNHVGPGATRSDSGGLADVLGGVLGSGNDIAEGGGGGIGGVLLDQVLRPEPTQTQPGNDILGQIFGSKDVSRAVADEVSQSTGLPADLMRKMLPILAMAVVGAMAKKSVNAAGSGNGMIGSIIGQIIGGMTRR